MQRITRDTNFEIGQLVTLFKRLGQQGPHTGINRNSFPWGGMDGQEEYIYWSNNPTFIRVFTAGGNYQDVFLVRVEYNDDSLIVGSPNGGVQRGTIVTTPLNGNYNNPNGIPPPGSIVQQYTDENDRRRLGTYVPNVYFKILQLNGNPLPLWDTLRNANRARSISNYLTGLRAERQGKPGGKDWQKAMREGMGDEVDELFLAANTPTGYSADERDAHGNPMPYEDLGGGRKKTQTKRKKNKKKSKTKRKMKRKSKKI